MAQPQGPSWLKTLTQATVIEARRFYRTKWQRLFWRNGNGVHGYGLWKTDGTEAGTVLVKAIPAGEFATLNGKLYFRGNDGVDGSELWTSDGTPEGTVMIKDIQAGPASSDARSLTNLNGTLIFAANDGMHGYEFWQAMARQMAHTNCQKLRQDRLSHSLFLEFTSCRFATRS